MVAFGWSGRLARAVCLTKTNSVSGGRVAAHWKCTANRFGRACTT